MVIFVQVPLLSTSHVIVQLLPALYVSPGPGVVGVKSAKTRVYSRGSVMIIYLMDMFECEPECGVYVYDRKASIKRAGRPAQRKQRKKEKKLDEMIEEGRRNSPTTHLPSLILYPSMRLEVADDSLRPN